MSLLRSKLLKKGRNLNLVSYNRSQLIKKLLANNKLVASGELYTQFGESFEIPIMEGHPPDVLEDGRYDIEDVKYDVEELY